MLINLALMLADTDRFRPIVLLPDAAAGPLGQLLDEKGIEWHDAPKLSWFIWANSEDKSVFLATASKRAEVYEDLLRRINADLVVVNTLTHIEGVLASVKMNVPYVLWVHGILDSGMLGRYEYIARMAESVTLRLARQIVCCSEWTKAFFEYRVDRSCLHAIHNWTHVPLLHSPRPNQGNFAALSTLEKHKGLDVLIKALAALPSKNINLDLYGDGADAGYFKQLVVRLGLADRVHFHGRVTDVNSVYDNARAIVFPSFIEPFGMVAIESMSRGTPVIASRVGGLREIIEDGISGLLCDPGDVGQLAEQMQRIVDEDDLVADLSKAGFERVHDRFNGDEALASFSAVLDRAQAEFQAYSTDDLLLLDLLDLTLDSNNREVPPSWRAATGSEGLNLRMMHSAITPPLSSDESALLEEDLNARGRSPSEMPSLQGHLDEIVDGRYITGWAHVAEFPEPIVLGAFIDGVLCGYFRADLRRGDLQAAGLPDAGFRFPIPPHFLDGQSHTFDIRLAGGDLLLAGSNKEAMTLSLMELGAIGNLEELVNGNTLTGWVDASGAGEGVFDVFADGAFIGRSAAEIDRPDVVQGGHPKGRGFHYPIPQFLQDGLSHSFEVRDAVDERLFSGCPLLARTSANGVDRAQTNSILRSWAERTFSASETRIEGRSGSWRTRKGRLPFIAAVADAMIPSCEILLCRPLEQIKSVYGIDYNISFQSEALDEVILDQASILVLLRTTSPASLAAAKYAQRHGIPVVYLMDDDLLHLEKRFGGPFDLSAGEVRTVRLLMRLAQQVIVFSANLFEDLRPTVPHLKRLAPAADIEFFDELGVHFEQRAETDEVRIGYAGTSTHGADTALISSALQELLESRPNVVVETIGQTIEALNGHPRYRAFSEIAGIRDFAKFLLTRRWAVALAPLTPSIFNRGKTDSKYRTYASAGIAGVYSDFGVDPTIMVDRRHGLIASESHNDWVKCVGLLLDEPDLRRQIVRNAKADVRRRYSSEEATRQFYEALTEEVVRPSIILIKLGADDELHGLTALRRSRQISLRRVSAREVEQKDVGRADLIVIQAGEGDFYCPALDWAREAGCPILTVVGASAAKGVSPSRHGLSRRRNLIVENSDMLICYGAKSDSKQDILVISNQSSLVSSETSSGGWVRALDELLKRPDLLDKSTRDVEARVFEAQNLDDEMQIWRRALGILGLKLLLPVDEDLAPEPSLLNVR